GRLPAEAAREIAARAREVGAPLSYLGRDLAPPPGPLGLGGAHQRDNAAIAVALARAAAERLGRPLADATIAEALAGATWPGRLERIGDDVLLDCAHNADGARALAAALPALAAGRRIVFLTSVAADKDPRGIFEALGPLALEAARFVARRVAVDEPLAGLEEARRRAAGGLVVVCGSMFLVGPLRAHLLGEPVDPRRTSDPVAPARRP